MAGSPNANVVANCINLNKLAAVTSLFGGFNPHFILNARDRL